MSGRRVGIDRKRPRPYDGTGSTALGSLLATMAKRGEKGFGHVGRGPAESWPPGGRHEGNIVKGHGRAASKDAQGVRKSGRQQSVVVTTSQISWCTRMLARAARWPTHIRATQMPLDRRFHGPVVAWSSGRSPARCGWAGRRVSSCGAPRQWRRRLSHLGKAIGGSASLSTAGAHAALRFTINGAITPQAPRPGRRHRKQLRNRLRSRALLGVAAAVGLVLIVAITVPAVLGSTSRQHGGKPAPTVTVSVPVPQPTVTVTVPRPGPTVTVTELQPGPTVTVRCRHPGRRCGGG